MSRERTTAQNKSEKHRADGREGLVHQSAVQVQVAADVALCRIAQTGDVVEHQQRRFVSLTSPGASR